MNKKLLSVIILHYMQFDMYKIAVQSVLDQDYENIELIFADDATPDFDEQILCDYIEANKKSNLKDYKVQIKSANSGTVRNVNEAIRKCNGEYIMFFAADDALYNKKTISNFVANFEKIPEDSYMLTSQCYMYDKDLNKLLSKYVNPAEGVASNNLTARKQFENLAMRCNFAIGASAFKRECFEKFGMFNEDYKIIEDWSYMLNMTRHGGRITYIDFGGLRHRDGGVSHYEGDTLPPHVLEFKNDMLLIYENEIIPYIGTMPMHKQLEIMHHYECARDEYHKLVGFSNRKKRFEIAFNNPRLFINQRLNRYEQRLPSLQEKALNTVKLSMKIWFAFSIFAGLMKFLDNEVFYNPVCYTIFKITGSYLIPALMIGSIAMFILVILFRVFRRIQKHFRVYFSKNA